MMWPNNLLCPLPRRLKTDPAGSGERPWGPWNGVSQLGGGLQINENLPVNKMDTGSISALTPSQQLSAPSSAWLLMKARSEAHSHLHGGVVLDRSLGLTTAPQPRLLEHPDLSTSGDGRLKHGALTSPVSLCPQPPLEAVLLDEYDEVRERHTTSQTSKDLSYISVNIVAK
ncbi:unnamed protein product [Boreogadus saida]